MVIAEAVGHSSVHSSCRTKGIRYEVIRAIA